MNGGWLVGWSDWLNGINLIPKDSTARHQLHSINLVKSWSHKDSIARHQLHDINFVQSW